MECPTLIHLEVHEDEKSYKPMPGTVVYIHPERRFYVVDFYFRGNHVRETFYFPAENMEEGREHARNLYHERKRRRWKNRHRRKHGGNSGKFVWKAGSAG